MKVSHIFWGTLFIALGLLILLNNYTVIDFAWSNLWQLWPIVIVLLGVSMLVKQKFGRIIIATLGGAFIALIIFATFQSTVSFVKGDFEIVVDDTNDEDYNVTEYSEAFDSSITKGILNVNGGAGVFIIDSTTNDLVYVRSKSTDNNIVVLNTVEDGVGKVEVNMKKSRFHLGKVSRKTKVDIALNDKPVWDLNFNMGAASIDLDLTRFKVHNLDVDMGAAKLKVTLGSLSDETNVSIDAGASKIEINIPEDVGAELKIDDVLSTTNIQGFQRIKSGLYRSSGFEEADKKVYLNIDCGVSSIEIIKNE